MGTKQVIDAILLKMLDVKQKYCAKTQMGNKY